MITRNRLRATRCTLLGRLAGCAGQARKAPPPGVRVWAGAGCRQGADPTVLTAAATDVLRAVNTIAAGLGLDDADQAADVASVA